MSPGGSGVQSIGRRWKNSHSAMFSLREELTKPCHRCWIKDQTSWNQQELMRDGLFPKRSPAPYYLGLNLCRCSILMIARSAPPIASES
jgi:hypothetical protein